MEEENQDFESLEELEDTGVEEGGLDGKKNTFMPKFYPILTVWKTLQFLFYTKNTVEILNIFTLKTL